MISKDWINLIKYWRKNLVITKDLRKWVKIFASGVSHKYDVFHPINLYCLYYCLSFVNMFIYTVYNKLLI